MRPMYAVMVRSRSGTRYLYGDSWHEVMVTNTHSGHDTMEEAFAEAQRIRPVGFNRDQISVWVAPWARRFCHQP